jgi:hypothetical protein
MPDWQVELEQLLSQLHVAMDGTAAVPGSDTKRQSGREDDAPGGEPQWEAGAAAQDDVVADGDEVSAVRIELEATVRRVVELAEAGRLEPDVRDDVLFVLQALMRPASRASLRPGESAQEWQLASAAAVLHFCRIVLRLARAVSGEARHMRDM